MDPAPRPADEGPAPVQAWHGPGSIWSDRSVPPDADQADAFLGLIEALRRLQAMASGSRPPTTVAAEAARLTGAAADLLAGYEVEELLQIAGRLAQAPGRAQALVPVLSYRHADEVRVEAEVTFSRFYVGSGAVHGGALPLAFDEILGRLAGGGDRPPSRTASLRVDYRSITPADRALRIEGWIDRIEGRKIFVKGALHDGETLLCEADGLFVELRPGQF